VREVHAQEWGGRRQVQSLPDGVPEKQPEKARKKVIEILAHRRRPGTAEILRCEL
jgi:hypothetical protein